MVGENKEFCSRSELIRVAVREFLVKELEAAQSFTQMTKHNTVAVTNHPPDLDDDLFVRVPVDIDPNDPVAEPVFKTYRIVKK